MKSYDNIIHKSLEILQIENTQLRQYIGDIQKCVGKLIVDLLGNEDNKDTNTQISQTLVANVPDGIAVATLDEVIVYTNAAFQHISGYETNAIGEKITTFYVPEEHKRLQEIANQVQSGQWWHGFLMFKKKDGSVFPAFVAIFPIYNSQTKLVARAAIIRNMSNGQLEKTYDVQERVQHPMEEPYQVLVDHSIQGLAIFQDGRVRFANMAMSNIIGYTVSELLAFTPEQISHIIHPDDRTNVIQYAQARLEGKSVPDRYEHRIICKDGQTRWIETYVKLIQYGGKPALYSAWIDRTEQKNAEKALEEQRVRFRRMVEYDEAGFLILDERDRIIYANQQARHYLHLPDCFESSQTHQETIAPQSFIELAQQWYHCHPQEAWEGWKSNSLQPVQSLLHEHEILYLVRPETSTTQALWLQVEFIDGQVSRREERPIRLIDVTKQMTRERQMWTFHSLVSHKFNTPMSCLLNSLHLLSMPQDDAVSSVSQEEFITIALESAYRLQDQLQKVRHFMSASLIAKQGQECPIEAIPQIAQHICEEIEIATPLPKGFEQAGLVALVLSREAITLLLRQILENAKKFHPNESPTIEVSLVHIHESNAIIHVANDGDDIPPEQIGRVWTPYYQGEKNFTGQVPGMGLGLAIVSTLLWSVGGEYSITNCSSRQGVIVELVIPISTLSPPF